MVSCTVPRRWPHEESADYNADFACRHVLQRLFVENLDRPSQLDHVPDLFKVKKQLPHVVNIRIKPMCLTNEREVGTSRFIARQHNS